MQKAATACLVQWVYELDRQDRPYCDHHDDQQEAPENRFDGAHEAPPQQIHRMKQLMNGISQLINCIDLLINGIIRLIDDMFC